MPAAETSIGRSAVDRGLGFLRSLVADVVIIAACAWAGATVLARYLTTRSGRSFPDVERWWAGQVVHAAGMEIEVEGLEHTRAEQSYVIISNHQSHLDICATMVGLRRRVLFVAKKELTRVPIFGQALAVSDHIVVDRKDPHSAIAAINTGVAEAGPGTCILFYAEGTRTEDGSVGEFKKGGVSLALRTGLPILPLSVCGTRHLLPKGAAFVRPGGPVRLILAPPIETAGRSIESRDELNREVRDIIVRNCATPV